MIENDKVNTQMLTPKKIETERNKSGDKKKIPMLREEDVHYHYYKQKQLLLKEEEEALDTQSPSPLLIEVIIVLRIYAQSSPRTSNNQKPLVTPPARKSALVENEGFHWHVWKLYIISIFRLTTLGGYTKIVEPLISLNIFQETTTYKLEHRLQEK